MRACVRACVEHLMSQLVRNDNGHPLFAGGGVDGGVKQEGRLTVRDEAPVLHRTGREVRNGVQICREEG